MIITFYTKKTNNRCPVKEFIEDLEVRDRARVLASLKNIEELGFDSPRVQFRQIRGRLWEIKICSVGGAYRIFYVAVRLNLIVLLHAYQKQSQKAPIKEIRIAEDRLYEVLTNEKNYA